jgi:signal transduction histidine kinase
VDVELAADAATVTVTVADNGAGLPVGGQRSGLENMRERAEQLGGMFTTAPGLAGGTRVTWSAPAHT